MSFNLAYKSTRTSTGAIDRALRAISFGSGICNNIKQVIIFVAIPTGTSFDPGDVVQCNFYNVNPGTLKPALSPFATYPLVLLGNAIEYQHNSDARDWYYAIYTINQPLTPGTNYAIGLDPTTLGANKYMVMSYRNVNAPLGLPMGTVNVSVKWQWWSGDWLTGIGIECHNQYVVGDPVATIPSTLVTGKVAEDPANEIYVSNVRNFCVDSLGRLWAAYEKTDPLGNQQIFVSHSSNGGLSWTEEQVTAYPGSSASSPTLAVDSSNNIHLAYMADLQAPGTYRNGIYYKKHDPNTGWGMDVTIEDLGASGRYQEHPSIAIDSLDDPHIVWSGNGHGANLTYYQIVHREAFGGVWQAIDLVTDKNQHQYYPELAIDHLGNLHVVWAGKGFGAYLPNMNHILYVKKTSGVWGTVEDITDTFDYLTSRYNYSQHIVIDSGDNPHIVFGDNGDRLAWYRKRNLSWSAPELVPFPGDPATSGAVSCLALDRSDNVYVFKVVQDGSNGGVVYLCKKTAGGVWSTVQQSISDLGNPALRTYLGSALWATFPLIGGVHTNIAVSEPHVVWQNTDFSTFYEARFWPAPIAGAKPAQGSIAHRLVGEGAI